MKRSICQFLLWFAYSLAWLLSTLTGGARARSKKNADQPQTHNRELLIIGTFYNRGWFENHLNPLLESGLDRIYLVTDEPIAQHDKLTYCCPPPLLNRLVSRAGAKFFTAVYQALRQRPGVIMGYHIFPAGVIAMICARLTGALASFQVTGGPGEWKGGGWQMENPVLRGLGQPTASVERAAIRFLNQMDWIIVRGSSAAAELQSAGFGGRISTITAGVPVANSAATCDKRLYDIVTVGRLEPIKRPLLGLEAMQGALTAGGTALIIGDGEQRKILQDQVNTGGSRGTIEFMGKVDNPIDYLQMARVFLLTSKSEGVSIALLEAMGQGCVPVSSNVGDIGDFIDHDRTGYLIDPTDPSTSYESACRELLQDTEKWQRMSEAALQTIRERATTDAIADLWRRELATVAPRTQLRSAP